ncbi:tRNA threonylcarbamoyladenosine biosynthesis protein TsaE [Pseudarcicella hirudinis]|uniref:tRNA threonylcarbamoyladenosine biosynthesis protein TsaE n=1 Tax=Pseudarcicella hirudinis TaxID=1079859 RepID=A0A1I5P2D0_9BACT|nr:tRNA (adenosine(37)-N6)-threonylcarbamoyltransferase complex ATPase subunit type 1 TsaE [Pseudarcicella hirudinis]SFP28238.1 tRNA threonylcarbamoyladenosine biosynthesis protein TsaE [Pseudarcicella hirudinis]
MITKEIVYQSLSEIQDVARQIIAFGKDTPVWLFEGSMGAGKTTMIKAIGTEMGVIGNVQSPTFSLVNEYLTGSAETLYHFDFYRIKNEVEAMDMGVEEYLDSGNFCFIEWSSKIENLLPLTYVVVQIKAKEDGQRQVILTKD